jgi:SWI/SNF-related matrix-associated actin-dependent regulator of chromatin subfamily A3
MYISFWIKGVYPVNVCIVSFLKTVSYVRRSTLNIYGASDKRRELEPLLIWATPGQRGFPPTTASSRTAASASTSTRIGGIAQAAPSSSQRRPNASQTPAQIEAVRKQLESLQKAAELRQMLSNLEKVDDEGRRSSLLDTLFSVHDVLNLPLHPSPPGILSGELTVDLLKHQVCLRISASRPS